MPLMLFAIVFGLSMDYEVFLLSRVREEYDKTGDSATAVADGLAKTARVITAAAAIMVVVFGSFVLEDDRTSKLFGIGLALAVLLDATIVRMLLVPATMELRGEGGGGWLDAPVPPGDEVYGDDLALDGWVAEVRWRQRKALYPQAGSAEPSRPRPSLRPDRSRWWDYRDRSRATDADQRWRRRFGIVRHPARQTPEPTSPVSTTRVLEHMRPLAPTR